MFFFNLLHLSKQFDIHRAQKNASLHSTTLHYHWSITGQLPRPDWLNAITSQIIHPTILYCHWSKVNQTYSDWLHALTACICTVWYPDSPYIFIIYSYICFACSLDNAYLYITSLLLILPCTSHFTQQHYHSHINQFLFTNLSL